MCVTIFKKFFYRLCIQKEKAQDKGVLCPAQHIKVYFLVKNLSAVGVLWTVSCC